MRTLHKLTDLKAQSKDLKPGRHSDGGGLYLNVSPAGTKSWVFMWSNLIAGPHGKRKQKRREMGLGSYPTVSLSSARKKAANYRIAVSEDRDPIAERNKQATPSFGACADAYIATTQSEWRNDKHAYQWRQTLTDYCAPIRALPVSEIGTDDVLSVLHPIWIEKNETASRLRGRIERVLDYATVKGWRSGENPARWRGHLKAILPKRQKLSRGHLPAMAYRDVPAFVVRLRNSEAMAARALEFAILTAARSGEVLGARWDEIDLGEAVWTIPARRMKAGVSHTVPLSKEPLDIVTRLSATKVGDYVFPGHKPNRPLSQMAMSMLLRRMHVTDATVHGFRSSFRDWCGDETGFAREIAEAALAHRVGDETERAYRRADALEKRRKLMEVWARFCSGSPTNMLQLHG